MTPQEEQHQIALRKYRVYPEKLDFSGRAALENGRMTGNAKTKQDLNEGRTDLHQDLAALQTSETRYRRLFETARDGILILNAETGQIEDVNPFLMEMLGYSHEDFLGKKLWEISPFRDSALNKNAFEELQARGYIRYDDMPLETKEGKHIDVEFVSNVYLVDREKVIQCNIRDITERKEADLLLKKAHTELEMRVRERTLELTQANRELAREVERHKESEEALRRSEEKYQTVANFTYDWEWWIGSDHRYLYISPSCEGITGYRSEEFLADPDLLKRIIHPDDKAAFIEHLRKDQRSRETDHIDFRIITRDGRERWISHHCLAVYGKNDEFLGRRGNNRDITCLKLRSQEIENLRHQLEKENLILNQEIKLLFEHDNVVGVSDKIKKVLAQAEKVAKTDSTVLLLGETGTGKELLARTIHNLSNRKDRPFVMVSCASLPSSLIEGELFGREKGAYTGALTKMLGRFEIADGSTLFLDEIGELPYETQSKLLQVLETGQFERLGSTKTIQVNVRIITATNRDLINQVREGKFRNDLYYRLSVFPITLPPLRERMEDIPALVWTFVGHFEKRFGKRMDSIPQKTMEALQHYPWPGNIRELRNVIEHAMIVSDGKMLRVSLPSSKMEEETKSLNLGDLERKHILQALISAGWRVGGQHGAAELLKIKRTTLQAKMKKLGIKRPNS